MLGLIPVYFFIQGACFLQRDFIFKSCMICKFTINCFQQAKLGEVWHHMVIVELHYWKERFLDSPLHVCVTLAIVCSQKPEENIKMSLLWEKIISQEDSFSSLNPLLDSAVFCNNFNPFDSWACCPATISDFFSTHFRSCDHESKVYCLKLFSFLPWTICSGWCYSCTCFFYAPLDTDLNTISVPNFSWFWLSIKAHKNLNTAVGIFFDRGGVAGVILSPARITCPESRQD